MERMQETFLKPPHEGLPEFHKFALYLKSSINSKKRIKKIDDDMAKEWERINGPEFNALHPDMDDTEKEFLKGFKVVNGCMKYVISAFNISQIGKDMQGESGLLLEHYLSTMEKLQGTFKDTNTYTFNLFIYYLRAIITDDDVVDEIDREMLRMRKSFGDRMETQQEIELGFMVVSATQQYLDRKMKINKKQVKILADQTDDRMPSQIRPEDISI